METRRDLNIGADVAGALFSDGPAETVHPGWSCGNVGSTSKHQFFEKKKTKRTTNNTRVTRLRTPVLRSLEKSLRIILDQRLSSLTKQPPAPRLERSIMSSPLFAISNSRIPATWKISNDWQNSESANLVNIDNTINSLREPRTKTVREN